jgi:hypothetical protein
MSAELVEAPRKVLNCSSSNLASASLSGAISEITMAARKARLMEKMAGFLRGKIASLFLRTSTQTVGLRMMNTVAETEPMMIAQTAP